MSILDFAANQPGMQPWQPVSGTSTTAGSPGMSSSWSQPYTYQQPAYSGPLSPLVQSGGLSIINPGAYGESGVLGSSSTATVDPRATERARASQNIDQAKGNILDNAASSTNLAYLTGRNSILDMIDSLSSGQQSIDDQRANAALSQRRAGNDIMSMVGRGIESGGVRLANKNAVDSSAAGQIARIYGEIGNREMGNVNNQYELANQELDSTQTQLMKERESKERAWNLFKEEQVTGIVDNARNQLTALDQEARNADIGTRFEIEAEKQAIKQALLSRLTELDQLYAEQVAGIQPMSRDAARNKAYEMDLAGQGGPQMFDFNTVAPQAMSAGGRPPAGGNLPIYLAPRRREG